ncbi:hypothetical protein SRABI26_04328 [Arthrobacter sp. Bi26]|nr:hypothetical protein SRABI26_04328 [Arthrobacter sp. Bi26]
MLIMVTLSAMPADTVSISSSTDELTGPIRGGNSSSRPLSRNVQNARQLASAVRGALMV